MGDDRVMDLDLDDDFGAGVRVEGAIRCVFSTMEMIKVGTGTTTRKHASKIYWFVQECGDKEFSIRQINSNHVPSGEETIIPLETLMEKYLPEIEFYEDKVLPSMEILEDHLDDGEEFRAQGKLYSAEGSFSKALGIDEENVRALFNLGMIYMELKDMAKAKDMMGDLLNVKAAFDGKNQHLFNEFGISLRKSGLYDESADYYRQALNYVKDDEHLFYNLARANFERSNWEECVDALEKLSTLNPGLDVAHKLIRTILNLAGDANLRDRNNKAHVPDSLVRRLGQIRRTKVATSFEPSGPGQILIERGNRMMDEADIPPVGTARRGDFEPE